MENGLVLVNIGFSDSLLLSISIVFGDLDITGLSRPSFLTWAALLASRMFLRRLVLLLQCMSSTFDMLHPDKHSIQVLFVLLF